MKDKLQKKRFLIERLERRLLLSADLSPIDFDIPSDSMDESVSWLVETEEGHDTVITSDYGADGEQDIRRHEIVFLDSSIPAAQQLFEGLLASQNQGSEIELVWLDSDQDGVVQITEALARYQGLDAVHLISHGSSGEILLGNNRLSSDSIDSFAETISSWRNALSADTDILLYGCNVADGVEGQSFLDRLSTLTGADVAASDDPTGHIAFGGDWVLEYVVGEVETAIVAQPDVQTDWAGLLAPATISGTVYADNGIDPIADGTTVRIVISGVDNGTDTTVGGTYSINVADINSGDNFLVYLDNNDGDTNNATTVSVSDGLDLVGLDVVNNHLITRHDNGGSVTNTTLDSAKGGFVDTEIIYDVTAGNLTVNGTSTLLYIPAGESFIPGGDVATPFMESYGRFEGGNNTLDVHGPLRINGGDFIASTGTTYVGGDFLINNTVFSHNSGTIVIDEADYSVINVGTTIFNDVVFDDAGFNFVVGTMDIDGDLSIGGPWNLWAGVIMLSGDLTTTSSAHVDPANGAIFLNGTGDQTIGAAGGTGFLPDFYIDKPSGTLFIQDTIQLAQGGWTFLNGNVDAGNSTVVFTETCTIDAAAMSFNNVEFNGVNGDEIFNINVSMDVSGDLTLTSLGRATGTIYTAGDVTTTTTSDLSLSGNVTFNGTGDQTLSAGGGESSIFSVVVNKPSGTFFVEDSLNVYGAWVHYNGNVNAGMSAIAFEGSCYVDATNMSFNNVIFGGRGDEIIIIANTMDIDGDLTFNPVLNVLGNTILASGNVTYATHDLSGPQGTLIFDGSNVQILDLTSATDGIELDVVVDKNGGYVSLASDFSMNDPADNFSIQSGLFDIDGFDFTVAGTFSNNGQFRLNGDETVSMTMDTDSGWITYNGSGTYSGLALGNDYNALIFASEGSAGTWNVNAPVNANAFVLMSNANVDLNGNDLAALSSLLVLDNSNLLLQGDETISASVIQLYPGSTVTYNGTLGPYTINDWDYASLIINGTDALYGLGVNAEIAEDLLILGGTLDLAGYDLSVQGIFVNQDTLRLQGNETLDLTMDVDSGTVIYAGDGDVGSDIFILNDFGAADYYNLVIDAEDGLADIFQQEASVDITGNLMIAGGILDTGASHELNIAGDLLYDGGLLQANNSIIALQGNWNVVDGGFIAGNSTVVLGGAGQSLGGTNTFFNLTKSSSTTDVLTIEAGSTQEILGTATLHGAPGQLVSLISDTPGEAWNFILGESSSAFLDSLYISDSDASGSASFHLPLNPTNSLNGGNTVGWFNSPPAATNLDITENYT